MAKKSSDKIQERLVTRDMTFQLSQKEIATISKDCAALDSEVVALEQQLAGVKKELGGIIKEKKRVLRQLLRDIREGVQTKEVECTERKDWNDGTVEYLVDGKVEETRDMTEEEKQMDMPVDKPLVKRARKAKKAEITAEAGTTDAQTEMNEVWKEETGRKTKRNAVDPVKTASRGQDAEIGYF